MQPAQAFAPNATTFLTHIVGLGLADKRYVVQRFKSMLDGDIRPVEAEAPKGSRRRTAKRVLATPHSPNRILVELAMETLDRRAWPATEVEIRVARAALFTAQAIALDLIAAGREKEVQEIRDFISTIVTDPDAKQPSANTSRTRIDQTGKNPE